MKVARQDWQSGVIRGRTLASLATLAVALGLVSVVALARFSTKLDVRDRSSVAAADGEGAGLVQIRTGDPRIRWMDLPAGAVSPLVADGRDIWYVLASGDPPMGTLYRLTPATHELLSVASFGVSGRLSALVVVGEEIAVAHGESITLVAADGTVRSLALPERPMARDGQSAELPQEVRALAAIGTRLYAVRFNVQGVEVIETADGLRLAGFEPLPADLAPPSALQALSTGELLVSSPFRFHDLRGGALILTPGFGVKERLDATPYAFAVVNGTIVATQTSQQRVFALSEDGRAATFTRALPLTGKEDKLAAAGSAVVVAPETAGVVFVSRGPGAAMDEYILPLFEGEPSWPYPGPPPGAPRTIPFSPGVDSVTMTSDGYVVILVRAGAGRIGVIPPG